ncbi:MAG: hypothetical protein A2V88_06630 [Elusimicrobia bacterium RBG_16_66_12]|nr:MAG: hypothetical protein A2V88_06630 [Elusimicrobia bacterium RBG_16_66_12]
MKIQAEIVTLQEKQKKLGREFSTTAHYEMIRISNEIASAEKDRDLARNKAIHITLLAYGVTPADSSGKPEMLKGIAVTNDASKGLLRHWHAIAADNTKERWGQGTDGVLMNVPPANSKTMALTGSDGITTLFEPAFENPAYLALILRHEREHFKQFITPGKGDKLTDNERDQEAWTETLRIINDNELGLTDKQKAKYKKIAHGSLGRYADQVVKERRKMSWSLGLWKPQTSPYTLPRIQGDLEDIAQRAKELDEIFAMSEARELVAQARQEREAARSDEKRRGDAMSRCWDEMGDIVKRKCSKDDFDADRFLRARECYETNARPGFTLTAPALAFPVSAMGCAVELWNELEKYPNASAGNLAAVARTVVATVNNKVYGCMNTMWRISRAACEAEGSLTSENLDLFYRASYCMEANKTYFTPLRAEPGLCTRELKERLERQRYSLDDANRLARDIWRYYNPPVAPGTPPQPTYIEPDPPRGGGRSPGGRCEDYGNIRCPK